MSNGPVVVGKKLIVTIVAVILLIALAVCADSIVETVPAGYYKVKQAAKTGEMTARMQPGMFMQMFGDIFEWPKAGTFYFTADDSEGSSADQSVKVTFRDGSIAWISGTCRIMLPTTEQEAVDLMVKHGYTSFEDLESKLILPVVRKALVLTANLMTAQESYAVRRADFFDKAWDQIQNGAYETVDKAVKAIDPISGEQVTKIIKEIKREPALDADGKPAFDKDGVALFTDKPVYQHNPLAGTGIQLSNFEVKEFNYSQKVLDQIAKQQQALMDVETAKANAAKAEQDKLTSEAQGKARVTTAQYVEEEKKIQAVVQAEKEKRVAELGAEKNLSVAELNKKAAAFTKQEQILLGEGEAARKKAVMLADGALDKKLAAVVKINLGYAAALGKNRLVPDISMGGSAGKSSSNALDLVNLLTVKAAKDLSLDMRVK